VKRYVLGVTGASGSLCARSVLHELVRHPQVEQVHVVLSAYALRTINAELKASVANEAEGLRALLPERHSDPKVVLHPTTAMEASISSGSFATDGMVVVPCSGGTLAAVARGLSSNLLQRACEVTLKERRPLVLALRESPLSLVHVENMRQAALAGAILYPLMPAFYAQPRGLDDIVEQFTARIFDLLSLPHSLGKRWEPAR
jgi:4-hydroxy-3-polyprenylbenzoate decarboxylase